MTLSKSMITLAATAVILLFLVLSTVYTVSEGYVGIVKRFGKAINQVGPGIHVKIPIVDTVTDIEVRQRKTIEDLRAATEDQLPITAAVSINWTVVRLSTIEMFRQYGNLEQFENRILNPKLRSATKAALSRFPANKLIQERQTVVAEIMDTMTGELAEFPITINSPQLENIELPRRYVEAVEAKETAREEAERAKHVLEQQRLRALQAVNSAKAEAEAKKLAADAEAYRVQTEAKAEASAIEMIAAELAKNPDYIRLVTAKNWNGELPRTMFGPDAVPLLQLDSL
jgi:regulator of protease activity HflC (stomatin/prohibitin superfamily)